jgi:hypothetical protein
MTTIINGSSPSITFSDSTTQASAGLSAASPTISSGVLTYPNGTTQASAGVVLQVVQATFNGQTSYSSPTSFTQSNLTASITPKFSTSKILVVISSSFYNDTGGQNYQAGIYRNNTTNISPNSGNAFTVAYTASSATKVPFTLSYLDSPTTTSSTSYTLWVRVSGGTLYINDGSGCATVQLMEIAG